MLRDTSNNICLGLCPLCIANNETIEHLFINFPFIMNMLLYASQIIGIQFNWHGNELQDALKSWIHFKDYKGYMALPILCYEVHGLLGTGPSLKRKSQIRRYILQLV